HVAIDEVVPGPGFFSQTSVDELTVNIPQGHGRASSIEEDTCRVRREPVSQVEQPVKENFTTFRRGGKRPGSRCALGGGLVCRSPTADNFHSGADGRSLESARTGRPGYGPGPGRPSIPAGPGPRTERSRGKRRRRPIARGEPCLGASLRS